MYENRKHEYILSICDVSELIYKEVVDYENADREAQIHNAGNAVNHNGQGKSLGPCY